MRYLTASLEDYIEIIYILGESTSSVGITDVAKALGISKPSVSKALNILKSRDLARQEKYGKISLTSEGLKAAKAVYNRHKILSKFLINVLNVEPCAAEIDACKIEHALSRETIGKIEVFLKSRQVQDLPVK